MDRSPAAGDDEGAAGSRSLSTDDILVILGHPLRREILRYCAEQSKRETDLDALTDHLVAERGDDEAERERIALLLHHLHLPRLADDGIVEFDPKSGQVRYQPDDELERLIGRMQGQA